MKTIGALTYHDDINQLPLDSYQTCLIDKDYTALIAAGREHYSEADHLPLLMNAWYDIEEQYSVAIGDTQRADFIRLLKRCNGYSALINQATMCIDTLEKAYHDWFAHQLNELLQVTWVWNVYDHAAYEQTLTNARNRVSGMEMHYEMATAELEVVQAKIMARSGEAPSRDRFSVTLNAMEEYFSVNAAETMTTKRYADRIKRLNELAKKQKH